MSITDFFPIETKQKSIQYDTLSKKYSPSTKSDFLDNFNEKKQFEYWLKCESKKHNGCIIYGDAGCGKTTFVNLLCEINDVKIKYFNSSQRLVKKDILEMYDNIKHFKNYIMVLDELEFNDMFCISNVIKWIDKQSLINKYIPIVFIIQSSFLNKINELKTHCLSIELKFPSSKSIFQKCLSICDDQGIDIDLNKLKQSIEFFNRDIRYIINNLREINIISRIDKHYDIYQSYRELNNPMYDFTSKQIIFQNDLGTIPILVQENYIDWSVSKTDMIKIVDLMSEGDVFHKSLFPHFSNSTHIGIYSCLSSIYPLFIRNQYISDESIRFGSIWTKQSSMYQKRKYIQQFNMICNVFKINTLLFFRQIILYDIIKSTFDNVYNFSFDDISVIYKSFAFPIDEKTNVIKKAFNKIK